MKLFDRIVLSCNEDPKYIGFWKPISLAWQKLFDVQVTLAFLTHREQEDDLVVSMGEFGEVVTYKPFPDIPQPNLAKMIRHIQAGTYGDERVLINDIDLLPLQSKYLTKILEKTTGQTLITTGRDLYHGKEEGKFTMGYLCGNGSVFREIINPNQLSYFDLIDSWIGLKVFDDKEDIASRIHHEHPDTFSDESLWRALLINYERPVLHVPRGFKDDQNIDRANWQYDSKKLYAGHYVEAHLPRPFSAHQEKIQPLLDYIHS
jgi:hypothetical protein